MMPKTTRIRISTRLTAFIFAVNLIPFFALLILIQGTYGTSLSSSSLLEHVRSSVVTNSLISISVGICLTILVSFNFSRPINGIILALKRVREGYLDGKVKVTTNDEIGYAGDVINEMTEGLKERERMKQSLELAKGQIIVLGTDGIWEARNRKGEIFGKDRFYNLIRKNANLNATSILNQVVDKIKEFQDGFKIEDDIMMVVIKIEKDI